MEDRQPLRHAINVAWMERSGIRDAVSYHSFPDFAEPHQATR